MAASGFVRMACGTTSRAMISRKITLLARENQAILKRCSPQLFQVADFQMTCRHYASEGDEYEKLWASATGGRGFGKRRKIVKGVDAGKLKHGRGETKWEGFNVPIDIDNKHFKPKEESDPWGKTSQEKKRIHKRGWSGNSWPGKSAGHPLIQDSGKKREMSEFDSVVIELKRVSNVKPGGRKRSQRALVVVGNKNGAAGFGVGKAINSLHAISKARDTAINYLYHVERCDGHTIFHNFNTQYKKTKINFHRKQSGFGLKCHRAIKDIAQLIGIQDMHCKVIGPTTPLSLVRAVFQGLISQETHQQLAERTGLNVVEFRQELGNRPIVVASPSDKAAKKALKKRVEKDDYDFDQIFDPYRGLHRPKHRSELF